jgi:N-ethylmaleimide reductase
MSNVNVFSPLKVGRYTVPNRVFMAPLTRNRAAAGNVPQAMNVEYYRQRAAAGLVIAEATQVSDTAQGYPATPGIHTRDQVDGWKRVTDAVHTAGGRIFLQIWHTGRASHSYFQPGNKLPVAPSAVANRGQVYVPGTGMVPHETPRALETREIAGIVNDFRTAAANADRAGFDGVEIHGANGYLVDQFFRDGTNQRTDEYGGSVENRARFALDVTRAAVDVLGADRVGIRLSPSGAFNDMTDSNPRYTFGYAVTELGKLGLAYLHITEAQPSDIKHGGETHDAIPASFFRPLFNGVLVTNGGFTLEKANQYLAAGHADAVAFGQQFIANPDLVERFRRAAPLNTPDVSTFYGGTEKGYTDYPALA